MITIPPEALEAMKNSLFWAGLSDADARAAILAALGAWPGIEHQTPNKWSNKPHIILPLPQENAND